MAGGYHGWNVPCDHAGVQAGRTDTIISVTTPELLNALRTTKRLPLRPPALLAAAVLNDLCGGAPPAQLIDLYRYCDGASERGDAYLRPLPISEVIGSPDFGPALLQRWRAVLCFADDESNYAGVYTSGPLAGMVFVLHHEEPSPAPRYWNIGDLLAVLADGSVKDVVWGRGRAQFPIAAGGRAEAASPGGTVKPLWAWPCERWTKAKGTRPTQSR
jgi:hypothetical protein